MTTRDKIIQHAVEFARNEGYLHVSRNNIAKKLKITPSLVYWHFRSKNELIDAVVEYAIQYNITRIIAQCVIMQDDRLRHVPDQIKIKAIKHETRWI